MACKEGQYDVELMEKTNSKRLVSIWMFDMRMEWLFIDLAVHNEKLRLFEFKKMKKIMIWFLTEFHVRW